jgi:hypothetical protein
LTQRIVDDLEAGHRSVREATLATQASMTMVHRRVQEWVQEWVQEFGRYRKDAFNLDAVFPTLAAARQAVAHAIHIYNTVRIPGAPRRSLRQFRG